MSLTRKQITFDLNQEELRQWYPHREPVGDPQYYKRAYKDIQRFMSENGFERRQRSVYVSAEELTTLDVVSLMQRMAGQLPWLGRCAEQIDATDIGVQHSLLGLLRNNSQIVVSMEQQMGGCPSAALSSPKHAPKRKKRAAPER